MISPAPVRVLQVEDNPVDAELIGLALQVLGRPVTTTVVSSEAALKYALRDPWDVVLADYALRGFTGIDVLRLVRALAEPPPVIIISGTIGEETAIDALSAGAADYLLKDRLARLPAAVEKALEKAAMERDRERASRVLAEQNRLNVAVLSSLSANIAVLGRDGEIRAVNAPWERFGLENNARPSSCKPLGMNYLAICDNAQGTDAQFARRAAEGIRKVLSGERQCFEMRYPCHAPWEHRWFNLRCTPLATEGSGAVVAHENVTHLVDAEAERGLAAAALDSMQEGLYILDEELRIVRANPASESITGYAAEDVRGGVPVQWTRVEPGLQLAEAIRAALMRTGSWSGTYTARRQDGKSYSESAQVTRVAQESDSGQRYVAVFRDVTEMQEYAETLDMLAHFDVSTGVPQRKFFIECLDEARLRMSRGEWLCCLAVRIDQVAAVNHTFGDHAGLRMAQEAARLLTSCDESWVVGRSGFAEFLVFCEGGGSEDHVKRVVEILREAFRLPMDLDGQQIHTTLSVGATYSKDPAIRGELLVSRAELALHGATEGGGLWIYQPEMTCRVERNIRIAGDLRSAIANDELWLAYQPRMLLASGRCCGFEALLRWRSPKLGEVGPAEFIPIAEDTGLIIDIGMWALRAAVRQLCEWRAAGLRAEPVAVNLSPVQLREEGFARAATAVVRDAGLCPSDIEFEITEGVVLCADGPEAAELRALSDEGFDIAIDDFGTGFSSLAYIKRIDASILKIDRSFIMEIPQDRETMELVAALHAIARAFDMQVVAEGVETVEQLEALRTMDCPIAQGYLISPPLAAEAAATWLVADPGPVGVPKMKRAGRLSHRSQDARSWSASPAATGVAAIRGTGS